MRVAGILNLSYNGKSMAPRGVFDIGTGVPKREAVDSTGHEHHFMEKGQVPFLEGSITLTPNDDPLEIMSTVEGTITLDLGTGKAGHWSGAYYAGDGDFNTEGEMKVRFEAESFQYVDL